MHYIKQEDYDSFCCLADACQESCCLGWQIMIDEDSLERYKRHSGPMQKEYADGIEWTESAFKLKGNRCYFLNDNGLCRMQLTMGEQELCYTCRTYPRHTEEYEGVRELSLSLSCPAVAKSVVEGSDFISLAEYDDDIEDDFEEFDYLLHTKLTDAREMIFSTLKTSDMGLSQKMGTILDLSKNIQRCVDEDRLFDIDGVIDEFRNKTDVNMEFEDKRNFSVLFELEHLHEGWADIIDLTWDKLFTQGASNADYLSNLSNMETEAAARILYSLVFTYYCGSVYDDLIYAKAALCVYMTRWILLISAALYNDTESEYETIARVTYMLTREIEHSDDNLYALDDFWS